MNAWLAISPWIAALPWLIVPAIVFARLRRSRSLSDQTAERGPGAPRVSIVVPARNEASRIERCLRSILLTTYANVELIVVDDHSTDATRIIADRIVGHDPRARVTSPSPLPDGWFGKQWACAHGAALATGELLLFTDADTWHGPHLIARTVSALQERRADLLSVIGHQEAVTFWEKVGQPAIFLGLFTAVGSTESMSQSREPWRKAANGQFLLMRRDTYDALDGHAAVRMFVAEDIMFAQTWTAAGKTVHALLAPDDMSTRMYESLGAFIEGWRKNVWAGGKHLFGANTALRFIARLSVPFMPFIGLIPLIALVLGLAGAAAPWWIWFGVAGYLYETTMLLILFRAMRFPAVSAFLYPLGCILVAWVFAGASIRGDRTTWKGREYTAA